MIQFSSAAASRFEMLDAHAQDLLKLIGRSAGERGALDADDVPAALTTLRAALAQHSEPEPASGDDPEATEQRQQHVGLSQRAWPLIDMLERAARQQKPVLWQRM